MILENKCKKCKRFGEKLFLKGERCYSPKCPLLRRTKSNRRNAFSKGSSEYSRQLLEKQKIKTYYGLNERQLKRYFQEAFNQKGSTPEILAKMLEMRFDSVIYNAGFAPYRCLARQLASHGHFLLNGRRHDISSAVLKVNDLICVRPQSQNKIIFNGLREKLKKAKTLSWLEVNPDQLSVRIIAEPALEELNLPFDFSLVVEFYSR